eukprot:6193358-Pleurochrysis_carterae.AAC.3
MMLIQYSLPWPMPITYISVERKIETRTYFVQFVHEYAALDTLTTAALQGSLRKAKNKAETLACVGRLFKAKLKAATIHVMYHSTQQSKACEESTLKARER